MSAGSRRRPGLRTAITLSFAVGGLVLSAAMALGTYLTARDYLIDQREAGALRQAFSDASRVRDGLLTSGATVSDVLGTVSPPANAAVVVRRGDRWFSSSLQTGQGDIPVETRDAVGADSAALSWHRWDDAPAVVVGVPLPAVDAEFFELANTTELNATLDALAVVLTVFAGLTAISAALLGRWASRQVIRPLYGVAGAAAQIASGALDTRLPATDDPDLATIVASFNSMVDAIHDRIERDARFAADVSHELRSPLTALVTSVDVLNRHRSELTDHPKKAVELIMRDLTRFQRALEDLLDLGRLEAGASELVLATVDARQLVRQALLATGLPEDVLHSPPEGASVRVSVDKNAMHRALTNLLENGDRHGGGVTGVHVAERPGEVSITVTDQGPGVPASERERIFQRFVRGGSREDLPGAGLGLSLVAETARAHGGSVWCSSGPGGLGAQFTIRLPAHARPDEP